MDIGTWLQGLGLERYDQAFRDAAIDTALLPDLTDEHLKELGIPLGHRIQLVKAIASLAEESQADAAIPHPASQAERRQLTVMFADLVGSTALSSRLDPEDLGEIIRSFQTVCASVVERFDGHVAKYMGDGVLIYFGYPTAHEDDAERAVRAGLELAAATGQLMTPIGEPMAVRIGIATGLVMVGELIGEGAAQEQAVVGETPNLAARLQALAEPGSVVIAPDTRRLLGGLFALSDLGDHELKGIAEPVRAFRVESQAGAESRFEAFHVARLTPLVGRDEELQLLLSRWHRAQGGEGQVVLLSGEPGIGKSRLARALLEELADGAHVRVRYQCSPHHSSSALHPVIEQLERAAGFSPGDPPETRLDQLEALLARSGTPTEETAALLASLLSIPTGERYPALELTPQRQKQLTLDALVQQLEGLASEEPVLVVLEDAHWIDPTTLELMIDRIPPTAALVLITCRPEFQPSWSGYPHITLLSLNRLGQHQAAGIIDRLTDGKALPGEVLEQIVAKTDGVPLFVEELTKTVLESGLLRETEAGYVLDAPLPDLAVPATLHNSLMARLDRLGPVKDVAQIGAAIGRTFSHALLAAVAGREEAELGPALDRLVASELVFRRGSPPDAIYSFKHALVQDAAYESLLRSRRRQLHGRIAQALEEGLPGVAEAEPEVLAHHHSAAGQIEAALGHWVEAGRRAAERSANRDAIEHLSKARSSLDALPAGAARDRRELDLLVILGPALLAVKGHAATEGKSLYARVRALCRGAGDRDQDFAAIQALRTIYMIKGRLDAARALGEELLERGERDHLDIYRFEGHRALGSVDLFGGCLVTARDHLERALTLYDPTRLGAFAQLPLGHPGVITLAYLGTILDLLGFADQAERRRQEAFDLAHEVAHPFSRAQALAISITSQFPCRRTRAVEETAEALLAISLEQGFEGWRVVGLGALGWARALQGHSEMGVADIRRGLAGVERMGSLLWKVQSLALLAEALGHTGQIEKGLSVLVRQRRLGADTGLLFYDAMARRVEGELRLQLAEPEPEAAEACFREALQIARRQEVKPLELQAAMALARLWRDQGKPVEAHDLLAPIYAWFTEGFDTPDLIEAKALLGELA